MDASIPPIARKDAEGPAVGAAPPRTSRAVVGVEFARTVALEPEDEVAAVRAQRGAGPDPVRVRRHRRQREPGVGRRLVSVPFAGVGAFEGEQSVAGCDQRATAAYRPVPRPARHRPKWNPAPALEGIDEEFGPRAVVARVAVAGQRDRVTEREVSKTTLTTDASGRLVAITDPTGSSHAFTYGSGSADGLLLATTDPRGNVIPSEARNLALTADYSQRSEMPRRLQRSSAHWHPLHAVRCDTEFDWFTPNCVAVSSLTPQQSHRRVIPSEARNTCFAVLSSRPDCQRCQHGNWIPA